MLIFSADEAWQGQLWGLIIKGRFAGVITFLFIFIVGIGWFYTVQQKYIANMLITEAENPIEENPQNIPDFGVGILGKSFQNDLRKFEVIIKSNKFSEMLEEKYMISRKIFNSSWNDAEKKWITPSLFSKIILNIKSSITRKIYSLNPKIEDINSFIISNLQISRRPNDPVWELRLIHADPDIAVHLLTIIHKEADQLLRDNVADQTRRNLDFLNRRAQNTTNNSIMNAISDLMVKELRREMLAGNDGPFAAEILIPPAIVPGEMIPSFWPVFLTILALSIFLGAITAFSFGLLLASRFAPWVSLEARTSGL